MPTPFSTATFMNRFINVEKLCQIKYTSKPSHINKMSDFVKYHRLPKTESINIKGEIREMKKKDITTVLKLFNMQQATYKIHYKMSQDDIVHHLMPKENVVWTYVIENDDADGKKYVSDFFSMYRLTQTCTSKELLGHKYDNMHSGNLFYYGLTENTLEDVVKKCLYIARDDMECDAFSCMSIMDNKAELLVEKLGFLPGDGALHWYLVNWSLGDTKIESNDIGTILI